MDPRVGHAQRTRINPHTHYRRVNNTARGRRGKSSAWSFFSNSVNTQQIFIVKCLFRHLHFFLRRLCMAFAPILRRASAAKNLFSLSRFAVGSSLSFRCLQTGASGDDSPPSSMAGYHVSSGGFMRGAVFREPNKPLTIEEFHIPRPKSNEVLIKTKGIKFFSIFLGFYWI